MYFSVIDCFNGCIRLRLTLCAWIPQVSCCLCVTQRITDCTLRATIVTCHRLIETTVYIVFWFSLMACAKLLLLCSTPRKLCHVAAPLIMSQVISTTALMSFALLLIVIVYKFNFQWRTCFCNYLYLVFLICRWRMSLQQPQDYFSTFFYLNCFFATSLYVSPCNFIVDDFFTVISNLK